MKRFSFRLDRVLAFRRMQERMEEIKLEGILSELRAIDAQASLLHNEWSKASLVCRMGEVGGEDLAALDRFREHLAASHKRLEKSRLDAEGRRARQMDALLNRRRQARLLEKLKQRRREAWNQDFERKTSQEAAEMALRRPPRVQ